MNDRPGLPEDDEPIRLDHEDVLARLDAYRRRASTAAEDLVDLTELEPRADLLVIPDADDGQVS